MSQYRTITPGLLDGYPHARARWLAEQVGAIVWQTATGEIVESRETWPNGTTGLAETPNNPAVFGWQRLTPS